MKDSTGVRKRGKLLTAAVKESKGALRILRFQLPRFCCTLTVGDRSAETGTRSSVIAQSCLAAQS